MTITDMRGSLSVRVGVYMPGACFERRVMDALSTRHPRNASHSAP